MRVVQGCQLGRLNRDKKRLNSKLLKRYYQSELISKESKKRRDLNICSITINKLIENLILFITVYKFMYVTILKTNECYFLKNNQIYIHT